MSADPLPPSSSTATGHAPIDIHSLHPTHKDHGFLAPEPEPATSTPQFWSALVARFLTVVLFVLTLVWLIGYAGGLQWRPDDSFFNLHAFFMLLGVGVFMTNSVVSWRDLPFKVRHAWVKVVHGFLNAVALLFIALGLYVTFKANDSPHFVTFHSWAALVGLLFLGLQAVGGIMVFALPTAPLSLREKALPKHAGLGLATYFILTGVCLLGIVEFLAMTTITAPFQSVGQGGAPVNVYGNGNLDNSGSATNTFFNQHAPREAYRGTAPMLGNVTALCLFAIMLAVGYSLVPRRNVEVDLARGPLRRGHGIDETTTANTGVTTGTAITKQWPMKDDSEDHNKENDNQHANVTTSQWGYETNKDISAV